MLSSFFLQHLALHHSVNNALYIFLNYTNNNILLFFADVKTSKLAYNSIVPSMGSPKVPNAQPHLPMADEKKSIKNILIKPFQALFQKDKKKEKARDKDKVGRDAEAETPKTIENINVTPVTDLLEKIKKLDLEKEISDNDDDEFNNFSYKIIKDEVREKRNDSHSSEDSGFVEKCMANDFDDEKDKVLVDTFKKLNVQEQVIFCFVISLRILYIVGKAEVKREDMNVLYILVYACSCILIDLN